MGTLAALWSRERSGRGQQVEGSLLRTVADRQQPDPDRAGAARARPRAAGQPRLHRRAERPVPRPRRLAGGGNHRPVDVRALVRAGRPRRADRRPALRRRRAARQQQPCHQRGDGRVVRRRARATRCWRAGQGQDPGRAGATARSRRWTTRTSGQAGLLVERPVSGSAQHAPLAPHPVTMSADPAGVRAQRAGAGRAHRGDPGRAGLRRRGDRRAARAARGLMTARTASWPEGLVDATRRWPACRPPCATGWPHRGCSRLR